MLKDINITKTDFVAVAIAKNNPQDDMWVAYLLNLGELDFNTVMVSSKGFGEVNGVKKETATLRWNLGDIPSQSVCVIEEIPEDVMQLNNEFFISFFIGNQFFDKKIVFSADSFQEDQFVNIPLINKKGILIK